MLFTSTATPCNWSGVRSSRSSRASDSPFSTPDSFGLDYPGLPFLQGAGDVAQCLVLDSAGRTGQLTTGVPRGEGLSFQIIFHGGGHGYSIVRSRHVRGKNVRAWSG